MKHADRELLLESIPRRGEDPILAPRGFTHDGQEVTIAVVADHTEGGETRLELQVQADYSPELDGHALSAYLDPLAAVTLGERMVVSGRAALAAIVAGLEDK